jgi:hypothetical protein
MVEKVYKKLKDYFNNKKQSKHWRNFEVVGEWY